MSNWFTCALILTGMLTLKENILLETVKKKFPGQTDRIDELYYSSTDFRSLCADYFSCVEDLSKYQKLLENERRSVADYEQVRRDLERELYETICE